MSATQVRRWCDTSNRSVTQVQHKRCRFNKSNTLATVLGKNDTTATRVENFDFDNNTGGNIFFSSKIRFLFLKIIIILDFVDFAKAKHHGMKTLKCYQQGV